ncbi:MAG TPA: hypothetical protein VGF16_14990 [Bryobacteraceae bacterium]
MLRRSLLLAIAAAALHVPAASAANKTHNVIFVMTDGLRWQEVFRGADAALIQSPDLRRAYWRDTASERREVLLPFLWRAVAKTGQVFGNRDLGCDASVTNGFNISYPGYNEALTGTADPRIHSNDAILNPNVTVLEWLNRKRAYQGRVAAFAGWDAFRAILNAPRAGFPVSAGYEPLGLTPSTQRLDLLNQLKAEMTRTFESVPLDSIVLYTALEYLKQKKPRVLFLSLGESDEWAHKGDYGEYLNAAHRVDAYLLLLWTTVQEMPEYKGSTTLMIATDHGRGEGEEWTSHGARLPDSKYAWMGFLGPDTKPLGERKLIAVTQNQIAATLAALLGEQFPTGKPIADILP